MTDQSSTGPEGVDPELAPDGLGTGGFGDDGVGTALPGDDANDSATATGGGLPDGRDGADGPDGAGERTDDPGAGRQGPMVDDASIDWSQLDGAGDGAGTGAPAGLPTDAQPTDGEAPAP
ncbi:hypothetical protein ELQ92_15725 [Labedella populi]|uniref:Uncharacterized protein n=1 Tax=Labedella populi TaxID=2498850 RepID=A0A3S4DMX5_9MICO|nr:hypothetical protein [Labedella populi]RWZ55070.1 hypothetical protein ELQ92_15725 [Labedella populi]